MPKAFRKHLVIAFTMLGIITIFMVILFAVPSEDTQNDSGAINVFSIDTQSVKTFAVRFEDGSNMELYKDSEDTWRFTDTDVAADYERAHLTATYLSYMFADHIVDRHVQDLSKYGLDNPKTKAFFAVEDGSSHMIEFGNNTVDQQSVYMRIDGQTTIYTIDMVSYSIIMGDAFALKNAKLPYIDRKNLARIDLRNDEGAEISVIRKQDSWIMIKPFVLPASPYALGDYANNMPEITLGEYVGDASEEEFGFSETGNYIVFTDSDDNRIAIELGGDAGNNYRYCMVEGLQGVYKIYAAHIILTRIPAVDFVNPIIWPVTVSNTKNLELEYQGDHISMTRIDEKWSVNGVTAGDEVMEYFFSQLNQVQLAEVVKEVGTDLQGEIRWTLIDGSQVLYQIYDYKKSFLAISQGGVDYLTVNKQAFEDYIQLLKQATGLEE